MIDTDTDATDWHAMWRERGERLEKLATELSIADTTVELQQIIIDELTRSRDMLARRCAEQAHQIAALIAPQTTEAPPDIITAVEIMNRQGIH